MKREVRTSPSAWDFIVIGLVLTAALTAALFPALFSRDAAYARITLDHGHEVVLPLSQDTVYDVDSNGYTLSVHIEDGAVYITDATCPDRVCVNSGRIVRDGEIIVCVPAMITVEIVSEKEGADYVVG